MADDQLTPEEIDKVRAMLRHVTFGEAEGDRSDVTLRPGGGGDLPGRIVAHNPGGTSRPFLTIVDGEGAELDVFLGTDAPGTSTGDARVGSVYLETGGGPAGQRPLKVHRRTADGWVWARWR